jgi:opacity protein-like surface antigen
MKSILYITTFLVANSAMAQDAKKSKESKFSKEKFSINASVANTKDIPLFNAIGVPNIFANPVRPWYAVGIEKSYRTKTNSRKYYGVELNYHDYKYVDKSIGATVIGGFDRKIYNGLYGGLNLGISMQKAKRADIVYTYEDGIWKGSEFEGKYQYNRQSFRVGAELGYKFQKSITSVYLGSNLILIRQPFGEDIPVGIYKTPIKIGVRKGLASKWF